MSIEQNPNDLQDESALSRFSARTRRALEAFRKSGMAERIEREAEAEIIEERRGLLTKRAALVKSHAASAPKLAAAALAASNAFDEAQKALQVALVAKNAAHAHARGAEIAMELERARINAELRAGADPRIEKFWLYLSNVRSEDLPAALDIRANPARLMGADRYAPAVISNAADIAAARVAIDAALPAVEALLYEPLTHVEVSEKLMAFCEQLSKTLEPARLNPPSLTAADAEPGPALTFQDRPHWIVDQAVSDRGDEVAARRAAAAARIADSAKVN